MFITSLICTSAFMSYLIHRMVGSSLLYYSFCPDFIIVRVWLYQLCIQTNEKPPSLFFLLFFCLIVLVLFTSSSTPLFFFSSFLFLPKRSIVLCHEYFFFYLNTFFMYLYLHNSLPIYITINSSTVSLSTSLEYFIIITLNSYPLHIVLFTTSKSLPHYDQSMP